MAYDLTTPTSDPTLNTDAQDVLATRALLTQLAAGEWLPSAPEEIAAALALLAQELEVALTTAHVAVAGFARPTGARIAWQ